VIEGIDSIDARTFRFPLDNSGIPFEKHSQPIFACFIKELLKYAKL
jgi:hypothetical protein